MNAGWEPRQGTFVICALFCGTQSRVPQCDSSLDCLLRPENNPTASYFYKSSSATAAACLLPNASIALLPGQASAIVPAIVP